MSLTFEEFPDPGTPNRASFSSISVATEVIGQEIDRLDKIRFLHVAALFWKIILTSSEDLENAKPSPAGVDDTLRGKIRYMRIFPMISTVKALGETQSLVYRSIDEDWYIADRGVLRRAFVGKVDILDFDTKEIDQLMPLIKCLGSNTDMMLPLFEVSLASGLRVERAIGNIHAKSEDEHICITEKNDSIKIVLLQNLSKQSGPRIDMELADFSIHLCAIKDVGRVLLISPILKASFTDDLNFCVNEAEEHAAAEAEEMAAASAAARGQWLLSPGTRAPDWKPMKHWTTSIREQKGNPAFFGDESTTADFAYTDE
ncbi:hypothetical protein CORC01_08094 [Colletotrichum orchidophilum]|uniref:Uncharacterized protein n=1 Tax=Colletotrichum orchidophilum TaxID=1209926 RepID=A0A1G4B5F8_9PEZI|nr:uncharacterized protein CORC01_08094 [Colletotrichum orchidophilum]OHE96637.1 hypothetical protein CORC01_08094 [Colletotrichum orchidophilum]